MKTRSMLKEILGEEEYNERFFNSDICQFCGSNKSKCTSICNENECEVCPYYKEEWDNQK